MKKGEWIQIYCERRIKNEGYEKAKERERERERERLNSVVYQGITSGKNQLY